MHAWIRARRATDRDLESQRQEQANAWIGARRQPTAIMRVSASFLRMLGNVLHGQPTVILRVNTVRSECLDMSSSGNRP